MSRSAARCKGLDRRRGSQAPRLILVRARAAGTEDLATRQGQER